MNLKNSGCFKALFFNAQKRHSSCDDKCHDEMPNDANAEARQKKNEEGLFHDCRVVTLCN
jgi:hypothetical protein